MRPCLSRDSPMSFSFLGELFSEATVLVGETLELVLAQSLGYMNELIAEHPIIPLGVADGMIFLGISGSIYYSSSPLSGFSSF